MEMLDELLLLHRTCFLVKKILLIPNCLNALVDNFMVPPVRLLLCVILQFISFVC